MSLWDKHLAQAAPEVLYHYATQQGLLGIVRTKSLWATSIHRLGDSTEFVGARQLGASRVAQLVSADAELAHLLKQQLESIARVYVYVCCFSQDGDLLSQWRAYCPSGGGVSLGFDPSDLRVIGQAHGFVLVRCIYDEAAAIKLVDETIHDAMQARQAGIPLEKIAEEFTGAFYQIAPAIKHRSFWEEREWRLVSCPKRMDDPRVCYREGTTLVVPYFDLSLVPAGRKLRLAEVCTGPSHYDDLVAITTVSNLLRSAGIDCASARPTRTPFRPR